MAKRFTFVLVAVALVAGLLVGCGSSATPTPTAAPTKAAATSATTPAAAAATTAPSATKSGEATKAPAATTPTKAAASSDNGLKAALTKSADWSKSFSADMVAVSGAEKYNISIAAKGNKMAMKMSANGEDIQIIMDYDKKVMYMYNAKEKTALQMPLEGENPLGDQASFTPSDLLKQMGDETEMTSKQVGTETIDGKSCAVYELKSTDGKETAKVWIWTDKGFPVKMEGKDSEGTVTSVEYKNIKFDNISDSLFELPKDATIQDMGSLFGASTPTATKK